MKLKRWIRAASLCLCLLAAGACLPAAGAAEKPFTVYLSPSAQPWNPYWDGSGSEEFWMRLVAGCMKFELEQQGVACTVAAKRPEGTTEAANFLTARAQEAEALGADLYVALHSNASPSGTSRKGTEIYIPSWDGESRRFGELVRKHFCYPDKSLVTFQENDELLEIRKPAMPHVLVETAYHDRADDGAWIEENIQEIAHSLACAVVEYAGGAPAADWKRPDPIPMNAGSLTLAPGGTAILTAAAPAGAVWSSGHGEIVSVSSCGVVTARQPGVSLVAVCAEGRLGFCRVEVAGEPS